MKNHTKKAIAFLCIFFVLFASMQTFAMAKNVSDKPLYEVYPYEEEFEYQDVIIAHALKSTVVKVVLNYSADLEYMPIQFNPDLLETDLMNMYRQYGSGYSSTEAFVEDFIAHAEQNITNYLAFGNETSSPIEGTFVGSGVVIDEDGYIATNSHVVTLDDQSKAMLVLESLSAAVTSDLTEARTALSEYGITLTDEQIESLYEQILYIMAEHFSVSDEDSSLEVWFPASDGDTSYSAAKKCSAVTVAEGNSSAVSEKGLTEDSAILKIDEDNLVALKIADAYPDLNSHLSSAGFPSASDNIFQNIGSSESILSVTVTSGAVSRLISIEGFNHQAIEITSTISPGNSGGPSVDNSLKIQGLNTYMNSEDNRYAYMIPAAYVNELAEDVEPEQGEVSKTFLLGLQMLQKGYGKTAVECFEYVQAQQPDTPYIETLLDTAKAAPQKACPTASQNILIIVLIASGALLLIGGVVVLLIILKNKKKKKEKEDVEPLPPVTPEAPSSKPSFTPAATPGFSSSGYTPPTRAPYTPPTPVGTSPSYTTPKPTDSPIYTPPKPSAAPTYASSATPMRTPTYAPPTPTGAPTYTPPVTPKTPGYPTASEPTVSLGYNPPADAVYTPPVTPPPAPKSTLRYNPPTSTSSSASSTPPAPKTSFDSSFKPGEDL